MDTTEISYTQIASRQVMDETIRALQSRNVLAEIVETKQEALERIKALIPAGVSVMVSGSQSLDEIGFTAYLNEGGHQWHNLAKEVTAEKDPERHHHLFLQSTMADFYLGSVHAISKRGELVFASASGGQLPAYCFNSPNVIWVVGAQKITNNVAAALERVMGYWLPQENEKQRRLGHGGSFIGKFLIFEREDPSSHRKLHLFLVNEPLGF
ncbi:LUD domain-containing protein [Flavisolibacter nicotianae]|uniref:LUD domain-containing protein n=1 Tax=Flavisolibacter nicotianae TaxID=2364882 RepID=UPI000EB2E7B8|nr:LUD domain-containing protein [Flavisolibacter nicotianae]